MIWRILSWPWMERDEAEQWVVCEQTGVTRRAVRTGLI
jgi:hypothetical protein